MEDWYRNPILAPEPEQSSLPGEALDMLLALADAPGGMVRNLFAGQDPLTGLFNSSRRATGADVIKAWSGDQEQPSDFASLMVDLMLDPLLMAPGLKMAKGALGAAKAGKGAVKPLARLGSLVAGNPYLP